MRRLIDIWLLIGIAGCIPNTSKPLPDRKSVDSGDSGSPPDADAGGETIDLAPWLDVSVGADHVCGIAAEGTLYCWGSNRFGDGSTGKLGASFDGDLSLRPLPVDVDSDVEFRDVEASLEHTCALTVDDQLYCWGRSPDGQVVPGTTGRLRKPASVVEMFEPILDVALGLRHTCILNTEGAICWGLNDAGAVGEPNAGDWAIHPEGQGAEQIVAGASNTCILHPSQGMDLECWGDNSLGILTDEDCTSPCKEPVVPRYGFPPLTNLSLAFEHACAVAESGEIYCWGNPDLLDGSDVEETYKLGIVGAQDRQTPRAIISSGGGDFVSVSAGWDHSCAVTGEGWVYCWGFNARGEIGVPVDDPPKGVLLTPVQREFEWRFVSAGNQVTCAIDAEDELYCWGRNDVGQLGNGGSESTEDLQKVLGLQ